MQCYSELQADRVVTGLRRREPVTPDHARVAYLGKAPGIKNLSAAVIVDVRVTAAYHRQLHSDTPVRIEGVVESGNDVSVDGADFVMMAGNLADTRILRAGARLVLIDEFITQSKRSPDSVHAPWAPQLVFSEQNADPQPAAALPAVVGSTVTKTMRRSVMRTPLIGKAPC